MGNVYRDFRDDAIHGMMDEMHGRLKNPGGIKSLGYHDRATPSLDYLPGTPLKIKNAVPQRITLRMPWE